jgi:glycosyltransferase involved in cell wall biosynthesis
LGAKVCYIPTGVDTSVFKPLSASPAEKRMVISWAGTLHKQEYIANIRFALDCFSVLRKRYAHLYFEIAGDGIYKESLLKIIQGYNDPQIIFKGWIAPEDMPAYLASIDIGVLPVVEDNKFNKAKSPTKLFEYMAMAKPTVSSALGENVQIIRDGDNGLLAKSGDDFTEKVRRLIDDAALRLRIGKQARASVESDYALDILGGRLFEAVKNACAE